jgi:hypothetical protein
MLAIHGVCTVHTFESELSSCNQSVCYPVLWNFLVVLRRFDMHFNEGSSSSYFFTATLRISTTRKLSPVRLIHFIVHSIGINSHERNLK